MIFHQYPPPRPQSKIKPQQEAKSHSTSAIRKKQFRIVLGSKVRSKTGCLTCRKRKKKCPEDGPICLSCKSRNQICVWPNAPPKRKVMEHPEQNTQRYEIKHIGMPCTQSFQIEQLVLPNQLDQKREEDLVEAMDDIGHVNVNVFSNAATPF